MIFVFHLAFPSHPSNARCVSPKAHSSAISASPSGSSCCRLCCRHTPDQAPMACDHLVRQQTNAIKGEVIKTDPRHFVPSYCLLPGNMDKEGQGGEWGTSLGEGNDMCFPPPAPDSNYLHRLFTFAPSQESWGLTQGKGMKEGIKK